MSCPYPNHQEKQPLHSKSIKIIYKCTHLLLVVHPQPLVAVAVAEVVRAEAVLLVAQPVPVVVVPALQVDASVQNRRIDRKEGSGLGTLLLVWWLYRTPLKVGWMDGRARPGLYNEPTTQCPIVPKPSRGTASLIYNVSCTHPLPHRLLSFHSPR